MSAANPDRGKSTTITTNRTVLIVLAQEPHSRDRNHNVHNPTFKETGLMAATGYGLMKSVLSRCYEIGRTVMLKHVKTQNRPENSQILS